MDPDLCGVILNRVNQRQQRIVAPVAKLPEPCPGSRYLLLEARFAHLQPLHLLDNVIQPSFETIRDARRGLQRRHFATRPLPLLP